MSVPQTVGEVLRDHVTLEYESIDRMYLNVYIPHLQSVGGVVGYLHAHKGQRFASTAAVAPMTEAFVKSVKEFAERQDVDVVTFKKGQRKDDVTQAYLAEFGSTEGVVYIGKAQEKAWVMRTERRRNRVTGATYPWIVASTAMVNHVYFYCVDEDFGPFFLKFCTYFPYNAKLCINGNEYAKCQLRKRGIAFEALDNGVRCCADPGALQKICDGLNARAIDRLVRKWFRRLPHPFSAKDRRGGCRYDISILQAEFCLTQVLDRPVAGRVFFEDVIRENLDLGRPGQVQLIFNRRVTRRTPGRFRTRVITDGVTPSLHVDYKHSRIKHITSRVRHCVPRPPSMIPVTLPSVGGCITWQRCARSAFQPTNVCCTFKRSATTVPWVKTNSSATSAAWSSTANVHRHCALPMCAFRH
jgi:hypothetical protein